MPVMPCGARCTRKPRSTSIVRRFRARDVARRAAADEPRLELRLDQHVALALRHRLVLLVLDVREADPRHLADDDAAVLDLRADVESLHRLVEIRLDRDRGLSQRPGADDHQHDDAGDDRADDEQAELEVVGSAGSLRIAAGGSLRPALRLMRPLRGGRTGAPTDRRSRRAAARVALGDDALRALVEHDHAVGDREDARRARA